VVSKDKDYIYGKQIWQEGFNPNIDREVQPELRQLVFARDNYTCQRCGRTGLSQPHCHHVRPLGCGGSNHSSNLITLCERCQ
jgi:5-methylcytosine-specific restriction endonuclease McrA